MVSETSRPLRRWNFEVEGEQYSIWVIDDAASADGFAILLNGESLDANSRFEKEGFRFQPGKIGTHEIAVVIPRTPTETGWCFLDSQQLARTKTNTAPKSAPAARPAQAAVVEEIAAPEAHSQARAETPTERPAQSAPPAAPTKPPLSRAQAFRAQVEADNTLEQSRSEPVQRAQPAATPTPRTPTPVPDPFIAAQPAFTPAAAASAAAPSSEVAFAQGNLAPGTRIAGYLLHEKIGGGGTSKVYRATQLALGRTVAVKILSAELASDETYRERFFAECRISARLDHPNILPVFDAGEDKGYLFIVTRMIEGHTLGTLLEREGALAPERALSFLEQAGSALDAAHAAGLIHRDVKPANLLIENEHLYLTDFGVAKSTSETAGLTRVGMFVGTIDYASPEQIRGETVDGRTDLYALACVFFQCLTGQVPFNRPTDHAILQAHLHESPPPLSQIRPQLPGTVDNVLLRAMAKDRDMRYASGEVFADAARTAMGSSHSESTQRKTTINRIPQAAAFPTDGADVAAAYRTPPSTPVTPALPEESDYVAPPYTPPSAFAAPEHPRIQPSAADRAEQTRAQRQQLASPAFYKQKTFMIGAAVSAVILLVGGTAAAMTIFKGSDTASSAAASPSPSPKSEPSASPSAGGGSLIAGRTTAPSARATSAATARPGATTAPGAGGRAVTLRPEQMIMPLAEFPNPGWAIKEDMPKSDTSGPAWQRTFSRSAAPNPDQDLTMVYMAVFDASANGRPRTELKECPPPSTSDTSVDQLPSPPLGDAAILCGVIFKGSPAPVFIYLVQTRNVGIAVTRIVNFDATTAQRRALIEETLAVARKQVEIIERVAPR